jgi:NAD+ diphosphatase
MSALGERAPAAYRRGVFEAGFSDDIQPCPGDLVVGVCGDRVRQTRFTDQTDLRVIGFLDDEPVWAGPDNAATVPWFASEPQAMCARAVYDVGWRQTHRFCGECGGPLDDCAGFPTRRCPRCTTRLFVPQALTPAVIVAIRSDDRLLLVRHANGAAIWALVAGMLEAGETLEAAVAREAREEVGLQIDNIEYAFSTPYSLDSTSTPMLAFTATCPPGTVPIVDGVELVDARWFSRAEIRSLSSERLPLGRSVATPLITAFLGGSAADASCG